MVVAVYICAYSIEVPRPYACEPTCVYVLVCTWSCNGSHAVPSASTRAGSTMMAPARLRAPAYVRTCVHRRRPRACDCTPVRCADIDIDVDDSWT